MKKNVLVYRVVAQPRDDKTIDLLFKNLDLIIKNKDVIFTNPSFYSIKISGVCIEGLYVGRFQIRLGDLIKLWDESECWKSDENYYFHAGGSPLSGVCLKSFWDKKADKMVISNRSNGFSYMFKTVVAMSPERFGCPDTDAYEKVQNMIQVLTKQKTK